MNLIKTQFRAWIKFPKLLISLIISVLLFSFCSVIYSEPTFDYTYPPLNIASIDGSVSTFPYKFIFPNGSVIDNGDGTTSFKSGVGSSGSVVALFGSSSSTDITTGSTVWVRLPYSCTITEWELTSVSTPTILVVDAWRCNFTTFNPATGPTITGGLAELPVLYSQQKNRDQVLTSWTTSINAGDYLFFKVARVTGTTEAVLTLSYTK